LPSGSGKKGKSKVPCNGYYSKTSHHPVQTAKGKRIKNGGGEKR